MARALVAASLLSAAASAFRARPAIPRPAPPATRLDLFGLGFAETAVVLGAGATYAVRRVKKKAAAQRVRRDRELADAVAAARAEALADADARVEAAVQRRRGILAFATAFKTAARRRRRGVAERRRSGTTDYPTTRPRVAPRGSHDPPSRGTPRLPRPALAWHPAAPTTRPRVAPRGGAAATRPRSKNIEDGLRRVRSRPQVQEARAEAQVLQRAAVVEAAASATAMKRTQLEEVKGNFTREVVRLQSELNTAKSSVETDRKAAAEAVATVETLASEYAALEARVEVAESERDAAQEDAEKFEKASEALQDEIFSLDLEFEQSTQVMNNQFEQDLEARAPRGNLSPHNIRVAAAASPRPVCGRTPPLRAVDCLPRAHAAPFLPSGPRHPAVSQSSAVVDLRVGRGPAAGCHVDIPSAG